MKRGVYKDTYLIRHSADYRVIASIEGLEVIIDAEGSGPCVSVHDLHCTLYVRVIQGEWCYVAIQRQRRLKRLWSEKEAGLRPAEQK